jgi:16S rRNA (guanine966-N2)-methyltransferase
MRVIAGEAHGRRLRAPGGLVTRPATARVRASIFSRLAARTELAGARVLDLFAGSGSLGLEALSRGAAKAVFVDSSRAAATAIRDNLRVFGLEGRAEVMVASVERAIAMLSARGERFDLVFVDPPYRDDTSAAVLRALGADGLLGDDAYVVVRQAGRAPEISPAGLEAINCATLGDHRIALYRAPAAAR